MQISFDTHPDRYKHWTLKVDGERADLMMDVQPRGGLRDDYELKLNSYDLGVDIELADAIQRLRFEHPEVLVVGMELELLHGLLNRIGEQVKRESYWVNQTTFWTPDPQNTGHIRRVGRVQDVADDSSEMPHTLINQIGRASCRERV